jgi:hypothetical protein
MTSWKSFEAEAPDLARQARELFDAGRHKTMATLRKDGSPRISGTEIAFVDGEPVMGMSASSVKAIDLRRDSRIAVHSASPDPPDNSADWTGDAKLSGTAYPIPDPEKPDQLPSRYGIDVTEVVVTRVGDPPDHILIDAWHENIGRRTFKRT